MASTATAWNSAARTDQLLGCVIGTDANGDAGIGNKTGVLVGGSNDTVGTAPGSLGAVVSGNQQDGIDVSGANATGDAITNVFVGVGLTGLAALGNGATGIMLAGGAANDTIDLNVIAGQNGDGIGLQGSQGNLIIGNNIGVGKDGKTAVGNALDGVYVGDTSSHIQVGTL